MLSICHRSGLGLVLCASAVAASAADDDWLTIEGDYLIGVALTDGSYGSRAVAIGEVPIRIGVTQFLEKSGTWFVRGSAEWVAYARHSFKHDGETQGAFQPGAQWGLAARVGARF